MFFVVLVLLIVVSVIIELWCVFMCTAALPDQRQSLVAQVSVGKAGASALVVVTGDVVLLFIMFEFVVCRGGNPEVLCHLTWCHCGSMVSWLQVLVV